MKFLLYYFIVINIAISQSLIYPKFKNNLLSFLNDINSKSGPKKPLLRSAWSSSQLRPLKNVHDDKKTVYQLDPILNSIRRSSSKRNKISKENLSDSDSSSSSRELKDWKDEWREHWIHQKFNAVNTSNYYPGDVVNMAAARPWGVSCGDPGQHDMPWGTCTLPMECDAEYRIYRGDFNCGRTQFVCCALQLTAYDMYQGFSVSFEDSGLRTDSIEKREKGKGSSEKNKRSQKRQRRKRRNDRKRRKRQIKKLIDKIQREIKKIINRQDRNATQARKRKTKQLKKFIDMLKKQYKKDRKAVQDIHNYEMIKIDEALKNKLKEMNVMNQSFMKNSTFRDIVVNGTLNRQAARMLVEAYPELESYINLNVRRNNEIVPRPRKRPKDYLDYDVEYGLLYF